MGGGGGPVKSSSTAIHELLLEMSFHPSTLSEKEAGVVRADEGRVEFKGRDGGLSRHSPRRMSAGPILVTVLGWSPNSNFIRERQKSCIERAKAKGAKGLKLRRCLSSRFERCARMVSGRGEREDHKELTLRCPTRLL